MRRQRLSRQLFVWSNDPTLGATRAKARMNDSRAKGVVFVSNFWGHSVRGPPNLGTGRYPGVA